MRLLLIPGMLCDARLWQPIVPMLPKGIEVEDWPVHPMSNLADMAADLLADLEEKGRPTIIAALSMGGYLTLELMRQWQMRAETDGAVDALAGLILIATSAEADSPEQRQVREGLIRLARMGKFKGVTPKLLPSLIHPSRAADAEPAATIFAMADDTGLEGFIAQEQAVMDRQDQHAILPQITCPSLIIVGDSDQRTPPRCSERMAALIPDSTWHVLEHCGHLPPLEKPDETGRLMADFIAAVQKAS